MTAIEARKLQESYKKLQYVFEKVKIAASQGKSEISGLDLTREEVDLLRGAPFLYNVKGMGRQGDESFVVSWGANGIVRNL